MTERTNRRQATHRSASARRARRVGIAKRAVACAAALTVGVSATAYAGGGVSAGGGSRHQSHANGKYARMWENFSAKEHRWAHKTGYCESGNDPKALGDGGRYRGAFMFTWNAWKTTPKSPGGDPIHYTWKTQATVAVLLKHRDGTKPWPVCG
jgi:Transglycosylase-like domain